MDSSGEREHGIVAWHGGCVCPPFVVLVLSRLLGFLSWFAFQVFGFYPAGFAAGFSGLVFPVLFRVGEQTDDTLSLI